MKTLTTVCAFLLLLPCSLFAQEQEEAGQLIMVQEWQVEPSHMAQQNEGITSLVEAAKMAELKDPGASWYFYTDNNTYTLVFPFENFAYMDKPMAFQEKFKGTAGEAQMGESFEFMSSIPSVNERSEIWMHVPGWSYQPEELVELKHASVFEVWVKSGKEEDYTSVVKKANALREKVNYPYMMNYYRVLFGDTGRFVAVTFHDDPGMFKGENALAAQVEEHGHGEAWQEVVSEFLEIVEHWEVTDFNYREALSYVAPTEPSAGH